MIESLLLIYLFGAILTAIGCALLERATEEDHPYRFVFRAVATLLWPWFWVDHLFYYVARWRERGER